MNAVETQTQTATGKSAMENALTTRDLCLWYGKFQALKNVTVDIKHGQITDL